MITQGTNVVYNENHKNKFTADTDLNETHTVQKTEDLLDNGSVIVATLENDNKVNTNYLKEIE